MDELEHIAFAKLAWREMLIGCGCHWDKVYSSLMAAAALMTDQRHRQVIHEEAIKFKEACLKKYHYRPPFEQLAEVAGNHLAGREVFKASDTETPVSMEAANRHLAAAMVSWDEVYEHPNNCFYVLGHLSHLSDCLVETTVEGARHVSGERRKFWNSIVAGGSVYRPDFEEIGKRLMMLAVDVYKEVKHGEEHDDEHMAIRAERRRQNDLGVGTDISTE